MAERNSIRFVFALHNHQPVGNFDGVIEQAYQDSYLPFLDRIVHYPNFRWSLHTSGPLVEWLDQHHPDYLDRLAEQVAAGRLEIIGGAFYEPILTMLPSRDRVGQIRRFSGYLEQRLGARVRGMWIPERVWEQSLTSDLADAGIEYTILDDFHFKNAGLVENQLHGYYLTEDDGRLIKVFPGSERLRYVIPFGDPQATVNYLAEIAERDPRAVVVFGDDGEKFGTWPETKRHVYEDGWLVRFLDTISAQSDWLHPVTLAEAIDNVPPLGKVYVPDSSYREMTEWVLPYDQLIEYEHLRHDLEHDVHWPALQKRLHGGFWRNFKVKYPEADEMYTRMLMVSQRLHQASVDNPPSPLLDAARRELYRGQCNCSYWHGAFGGIYLPHLRNAVYNHLIAADNLLDQVLERRGPWVEGVVGDFNLDARQEVMLANNKLIALVAPSRGGQIYELDVRSICHNLGATLARRPEAYHEKVAAGERQPTEQVASIHDRVVFKQAGLDQRLQYDSYPRKSLLDHFYDEGTSLADVVSGKAIERADFLQGVYETRIRRQPGRVQAVLSKSGNVWGHPVRVTKSIALDAGSSALSIVYLLEGLPEGSRFHFSSEFNFAGLPSGADDRYFFEGSQRLGQLGAQLDLANQAMLGLRDEWLGLAVRLEIDRPTGFWTFPIESVSQSEGGFELVHQSVAVLPHWIVEPDAQGRWSVTIQLAVDTALAESRQQQPAPAVAVNA